MLSAIIGVLASVVSGSVELGVYVVLGSLAGVVAVRRGERLQQFVQAAALDGLRQRRRHRHLRPARRARPDRHAAAHRRRRRGCRRRRRGGRRDVRGAGQRLRLHDLVPAARAGQPVAAAPAPAAARDVGHVPPLADGRQPRRACRRGDGRRSAARAGGRLLPRRRQAGQPDGLHREPGGRRQPARRADAGGVGGHPQGARGRRHRPRLRVPAAEAASSRSSRSTTARPSSATSTPRRATRRSLPPAPDPARPRPRPPRRPSTSAASATPGPSRSHARRPS